MRLSVVTATRNDGHGNGQLQRIDTFVRHLVEQCQAYRLEAELIIVEWNPPVNAVPLHRAVTWPEPMYPLVARVIEVPSSVHDRQRNSDEFDFFQMAAKNVGIRRAWGEFVVCTNIDNLFANEIVQYIAGTTLDHGRFYRAPRYGLTAEQVEGVNIHQRQAFCDEHIGEKYDKRQGIGLLTNACGDFTMAAVENWYALRGYPEYWLWSIHIDSLFLFMLRAAGLKQKVFDWPVYHVDHKGGCFNMTRQEKAAFPQLDYDEMKVRGARMVQKGKPPIDNGPHWGLAEDMLHETVIGKKGRLRTEIMESGRD